jgi:type I restriction enzyme, S subunit
MPKVNREALGDCWLWFPDLERQDEILRSVDRSSRPSTMARARTEAEIALLKEFHARLIADVVTGKLDVREAANRLPGELVESWSFNEADELTDEDVSTNDLEPRAQAIEA